MQVKISKSQWELMGKQAGWMKTAEKAINEYPELPERPKWQRNTTWPHQQGESYLIPDVQKSAYDYSAARGELHCDKCKEPISEGPVVVDVEWDMSGNDDNYYTFHPACTPVNLRKRRT